LSGTSSVFATWQQEHREARTTFAQADEAQHDVARSSATVARGIPAADLALMVATTRRMTIRVTRIGSLSW
jgi:hypothetical protein